MHIVSLWNVTDDFWFDGLRESHVEWPDTTLSGMNKMVPGAGEKIGSVRVCFWLQVLIKEHDMGINIYKVYMFQSC